jgi:hypothetical protein
MHDHTYYSYSTVDVGVIFVCTHNNYNLENPWFLTLINDSCNWQLGSPRFLWRPMAFCSTCWSRAVGRQSALHKENSRFAAPTLGRHVSWLSDFIFYPKPLYKSLHQSFFYSFITILPSESGVTLDYSTIFPWTLLFRHITFIFKHLSHDWENYDYRNVSWEMIYIYDLTLSKMRGGET